MAFVRPTLPQLVTRVQLDFISRLSLTGAVLRRSMVAVFARVVAGAAHMLHGHLEYLARQIFPDQSDVEFLARQASLFGIVRVPPSYATVTGAFVGVGGTVVPAGTLLVSPNGFEFVLVSDVTVPDDGSLTARVAGKDATVEVGVVMSLSTPVAGVNSSVEVVAASDGADEESVEGLRTRFLERLDDPPHGGTVPDYIAWAKEVPGVTRVWVSPRELGPGTVVVRFARDGDGTSIPDSGEVAVVQAKLSAEAPVHVEVTAAAPIAAPINFTLQITPDSTAMRAAVTAQLNDLLQRTSAPGATVLLSAIRTAIGTTPALTNYALSSPATDVSHTTGQLPTVGSFTWI